MNLLAAGFLGLAACYAVSHVVREKAFAHLTPIQIGELVVAFRAFRRTYFIAMLIFVAAFLATHAAVPNRPTEVLFIFSALAIGFFAVRELHGWRIMRTFSLPTEFMNKYRLARALIAAGLVSVLAGAITEALTA